MSDAKTAAAGSDDFWWGLGANVESQSIAMGVSAMVARMSPVGGAPGASCVIRVSSVQFGPGLGGGGDVVLVIATGIAAPVNFPMARIDGGWSVSFRDAVSFTSTPASCYRLAAALRTVPVKDILDFTIKNPAYVLKFKDAVSAFYNTMVIGADTAMRTPALDVPRHGRRFRAGPDIPLRQ
jgi:hypothetical protein